MSKFQTTPSKHLTQPPMGWNSWDCFGASVTEQEVLANATIMQEHLLPYGWDTIVVDIQWSHPTASGWRYHAYERMSLDAYGRQLPATNRFPSAQDGQGFTSLAKQIHDMGFLFGVHLLRGIPRQAVHDNLPILGTDYTARDVADTSSICAWNTDMYGLKRKHPGAQAYYDSVFALFAQWGVDYVKVDDIAWNFMAEDLYPAHEVEMIHRAILASGRPMTLSLSPGPADPRDRTHFQHYANAWRITDDFWDQWPLVQRCLDACVAWAGDSGCGSWPDADMLPFGRILLRETGADGELGKQSAFTVDEEQLVFRLWCLMRSPLMLGADLPTSPPDLIPRLNQPAYLEWSQYGSPSMLLSEPDAPLMVWTQEQALPEQPTVIAGEAAGPSLVGPRFPLLLVNRSDEPLTLDLETFLLAHASPGRNEPTTAWYEIGADVQETRLPVVTVEPHASRGFVYSP